MPPQIATAVFALGILGLFLLDRDRESRTSIALWIPVVWIILAGSRPLSVWLQLAPPPDSELYLEGSPVDRAVFIGLMAVGLIVLASGKRQAGKLLKRNGPILVYFSYCALSILWSDYPGVAFKRWTKAVGDIVMLLIVLTDSEPVTALKRLLTRIGFLLVPVSVLFIKYYPDLGRGYNRWTWLPVWTGVATNKNELGMICMIFGLASLWRLFEAFRDENKGRRAGPLIAHGSILAMVLWLLLRANSMTSLSCFVLAGILLAATSIFVTARRHVHLVVAAVVGIAVFALFFDSGGGLVGQLGRDPTLTGRTELWNVLPQFSPHPLLGAGYQSFWLGDRLQQIRHMFEGNPLMEAHNGYLEVFLNLGWIGLAVLAFLIVAGYRNTIAAFRHDPETGNLRLAYFVVAVIYNFTEAAFKELNLVWIFFLLAILAVPEAPLLESAYPLGIEDTNTVEVEPQFVDTLCAGH